MVFWDLIRYSREGNAKEYERQPENLNALPAKGAFMNAENRRLQEIKENHKGLYAFFAAVFIEGKRDYFSMKESKIYSLNSNQKTDADDVSIVDIIPVTKEDPDELELFMKQFMLTI